jgi:hypothetical protein
VAESVAYVRGVEPICGGPLTPAHSDLDLLGLCRQEYAPNPLYVRASELVTRGMS